MRLKVVVVAVALVLALAVPTAAVTGSGDDAGAITMAPHSGPNGQYASVSDGEIEVTFDGLNDDAVTTAHDVFTITLDGGADCASEVWVELDDVAVYRSDDPSDRIDAEDDAVVVQPGETVAVGFQLDTTATVPDPDDMTVHAAEASDCGGAQPPTGSPNISANVTVDDGSDPLEKVVTVTVRNTGTAPGSYVAEPTTDGTVVGSQPVTVGPGEVRELVFVHRFDSPGTYRIAVGDSSVDVSVAARGPAPEFRVTALETAGGAVRVGAPTDVVATVENVGQVEGTYAAVLTVDGTAVAVREVTVPAGETRTVTFAHAFDEPGDYDLAVGEQRATVTVEAGGSGVRVVDASVADRELSPGDVTTISAVVENGGETDGETTLDVRTAGVVVESVSVTVPAGESRTVTVERGFDTPGVYAVAVEGVDAGEVVVRAGGTTANRLLPSSLGTAVLAPVLVGLLLAMWRRRLLSAAWQRL